MARKKRKNQTPEAQELQDLVWGERNHQSDAGWTPGGCGTKASRKGWRPLPGAHRIPLGQVWSGRLKSRDRANEECCRWLVELRVGEVVTDNAPLRVLRDGLVLPERNSHPTEQRVVLAPCLVFRPCLHRIQKPFWLEDRLVEWRDGLLDDDEHISNAWLLGREGRLARNRVPLPGDITSSSVTESFDHAAAIIEQLTLRTPNTKAPKGLSVVMRLSPWVFLSPAAHIAHLNLITGAVVERTEPAILAAQKALPLMQRLVAGRGSPPYLQLPDEAVDLFQSMPSVLADVEDVSDIELKSFVAHLASTPGPQREEEARSFAGVLFDPGGEVPTWVSKQRNAKHGSTRSYLLQDLIHQVQDRRDSAAVNKAAWRHAEHWLNSDPVRQAVLFLESLRWCEFETSPLLHGWSSTRGTALPFWKFTMESPLDDMRNLGKVLAAGAEVFVSQTHVRWFAFGYAKDPEALASSIREEGFQGKLVEA